MSEEGIKEEVKETNELFLPFVVKDKGRQKEFPKDMEIATIFCYAETEKGKGRGIIFKRPPENIKFIALGYYPIWIYPWEKNENLLFDGFGLHSTDIIYKDIPNVSLFNSDIRVAAERVDFFKDALTRHLNTFNDFVEERKYNFEALISEEEFVFEILQYLKTKREKKPKEGSAFVLAPQIGLDKIEHVKVEILNLKKTIEQDLIKLDSATATLNDEVRNHVSALYGEMNRIRGEYEDRINAIRPTIEKEVKELEERCVQESNVATQRIIERKNLYLKQISSYQEELTTLKTDLQTYKQRLEDSKKKRDPYGEKMWKREIESAQKKLDSISNEVDRLKENLKEIEKEQKTELDGIRGQYARLIDDKWRRVRELEGERDAKIDKLNLEVQILQDFADEIAEKIRRLSFRKKESLEDLEKLKVLKAVYGPTILYIPFYAIRYESKEKVRYKFYPPSTALEKKGLVRTLFMRLGKLILPLKVRSKVFEKTFKDKFLEFVEENFVVEREIYREGLKCNVLTPRAKRIIRKGLNKILDEGWISKNKYNEFLEAFDSYVGKPA